MTHKYLLGILALSAVSGIAHAGAGSALILDDFDADPNDDALGAATYSSTIFNDPFNQGATFNLDTGFNSGSDVGAVFFNSGIGVEQGASISYNNDGAGLNLDGIAMGIDSFEIDFLLSDQQFVANIVMTTYDEGGIAIGDARWAVLVEAGGPSTAHWTFADFIIINGDFDASNIDDITINFNLRDGATPSLDFVATEFRANVVPAPGAIALLGLGGLVATRRRR